MKMKDIVNQLFAVLPRITDYFTDDLDVVSVTSFGTTATVITSAAHGLTTGDYAHISGALTPNLITTLTQVDNIAAATTSNNHDLTQGFQTSVTIVGATEPEYNGTLPILTAQNRKNFTYQISGDPSSPATGTPTLLEDLKYGYNGWHEVTVIDTTTFTYEIPKSQGSPAAGTIKCRVSPRISASVSLERAVASYTKKGLDKFWAFVVMGNRAASKDRSAVSDATSTPGQGEAYRQLVIQPFSIYVFIPSTAQIAARDARDKADDLLALMCKSVARVYFPTVFAQPPYSPAVFDGDSFGVYNNAIYVHEFSFETTEYITYDDTVDPDFGTAFRDIDLSYLSSFSDEEIMTDKIDLDNEPL